SHGHSDASVSCSVSGGGACPAVGSSGYAKSEDDPAGLGLHRCNYNYVYPACNSLASSAITEALLMTMTASPTDDTMRACTYSGSLSATLASDLDGAGFDGPMSWSMPSGNLMVIRNGAWRCADSGAANSVSASNIGRLSKLPKLF